MSTLQSGSVQNDDEAQVAPKFDKPKRRRGRPPGAKNKVANAHVSADEFALLRAMAQGVDISVAARQFLLWPSSVLKRPALLSLHNELLHRVEVGARTLPEVELAGRMVHDLLSHQHLASEPTAAMSSDESTSPPPDSPRKFFGTMQEYFEAQSDKGVFRSAETIGMDEKSYHAEHEAFESVLAPSTNPTTQLIFENCIYSKPHSADVEIQITAINWLDDQLGKRPSRDDCVAQWVKLNKAQRQTLSEAEVISLGNLVDWITRQGNSWIEKMPGYSETRGDNLLQWFKRWEIEPSVGLKPLHFNPPSISSAASADSVADKTDWQARLIYMDWPVALNGSSGKFRSAEENILSAHNDQEAVQAWLHELKEKSALTQTAYRRGVERLIFWAVHERGRALSSLTKLDMQDFKEFLSHPPPHWVQDSDVNQSRKAGTWRPLKGPLNQGSLNLTFAAINSMYSYWLDSRYTTLNPARDINNKMSDEPIVGMMRSFTDKDLEVIARTFEKMSDNYAKRRLRAIFRLLEMGGLRRKEASMATWGQVQWVQADDGLTEDACIQIIGKGNRQRMVPLHEDVLEALRDHLRDRKELMGQGKMLQFKEIPDSEQPLLGVLDDRWIKTQEKQRETDKAESVSEDDQEVYKISTSKNGALSVDSIYQILKEFFRACSVTAGEDVNDELTTFKRASTHWLRHTFANNLLKQADLDVVQAQALLGHKSLQSMRICVRADIEKRWRRLIKFAQLCNKLSAKIYSWHPI